MKKNVNHIILCALVILFSVLAFNGFDGKSVQAATDGYIQQSYNDIDQYYGRIAPDCDVEDYIFAGWYTDEACEIPYVKTAGENVTTFYAKFVPKEVLSVMAQTETRLNNNVLADDATGKIRFVTAVDSTNYQDVGFYVSGTFENVTLENEKYSIPKVFSYLYVVGTTDDKSNEKTATETFGLEQAKFFAPHTFNTRFDQFDDKFEITPYWVTPDGVEVKGVYREVSLIDNLEFYSCAEVNGRAYYTSNDLRSTILEANKFNGTEENPTVVTLLKDVELINQVSISGFMKITNNENTTITISKADTYTSTTNYVLLHVPSGASLVIEGANEDTKNGLTITGNDSKALFRNSGSLVVKNATLTNGYRADYGGVLFNDGVSIVNNCNLKNNVASKYGGAIYSKGGTIQISNSCFESNKATINNGGAVYVESGTDNSITNTAFYKNSAKHGGALSINNTKVTITSCEFGKENSGNSVTTNGGAIYVDGDNGYADLNVDSKYTYNSFKYNKANSGGAILVYKGKVEATGYVFEENDTVGNSNGQTGGAVRILSTATSGTFTSCNFLSNNAYSGGAIFAQNSLIVNQCDFESNTTTTSHGGAILASSTLDVDDSSFSYNRGGSSSYGGAITQNGGTGTVDDAEFYGNHAINGGAVGGVGGTLTLTNCDFSKVVDGSTVPNTAETAGGLACVTSSGKIYFHINDDVERDFTNNVDANGRVLYAKASSIIEYSALYSPNGDATYKVEGNPSGTVTRK